MRTKDSYKWCSQRSMRWKGAYQLRSATNPANQKLTTRISCSNLRLSWVKVGLGKSLSKRCLGARSLHLRLKGLKLHPSSKLEMSLPLTNRDLMLAHLQPQNHLLLVKTKGKNLDKNLDPDSWWLPSLLTKRLIAMLKCRNLLRCPIQEILLFLRKGLNQRFQELQKLQKQLKLEIKKDRMTKL